jgi:hypothetical protein
MPTNYEREEAIRRAEGMLSGGFEAEYIYGKLLKEGFEESDAAGIIQRLTGKPFKPSATPASSQAASSIAELPNFSQSTKPEPAVSKAPEPVSSPQPAAPVEEPSTLAELLNASQTSSPGEVASPAAESASLVEAPDTLSESISTAQAESPVETESTLAELVNSPEVSKAVEAPAESPSPAPSSQPSPIKTGEQHRREATEKAIALRESGYNVNFIYQRLINEGYSHEIAQSATQRLSGNQFGKPIAKAKADVGTYRRTPYTPPPGQASNSDGGTQVMIGIVMIVIGCGVTFFSYQAAANSPTGGTYIVTFGLIIAGIFRVIRGLSN